LQQKSILVFRISASALAARSITTHKMSCILRYDRGDNISSSKWCLVG
jgi:hypothetical protein